MHLKRDKLSSNCAFHIIQLMGDRDEQEDSYGVLYRNRTTSNLPVGFLVADGMGGHVAGSVASQTVVDSTKLCFENSPEVLQESIFEEIILSCTENVRQCVEINPEFSGMGSTIALALFEGRTLRVLSVGDSLILGYSAENGLSRLNDDHSMRPVLEKLITTGELSLSEEEYHSKKNMLRSAITGSKVELFDAHWERCRSTDYDYLLVASDGIETLGTDDIEQILIQRSKNGPASIARDIISAISQRNASGQDNVTLIVIDPGKLALESNHA